MVSLFKNSLQLNMYYDKLFEPQSKVSIKFKNTPSHRIDCASFQHCNGIPTNKLIFMDFSSDTQSINKSTTIQLTINHSNMTKSKDKVFFIQYTHNGTVRGMSYLVRVYR